MNQPLYSQSWYRVASLKPRLRAHARVHRHDYRDEVWYVLEDTSSGRCHRFSESAHALIGLMDGSRSLQEIWDAAAVRLGDDAPTQDETIQLLGKMHASDILICDLPPDSREIVQRRAQQERRRLWQRLAQPLAVRIPLFDPDRFLTRWMPLVSPIFGWLGALLWISVVVTGGMLAASHWPELTGNLADRVLAAESLVTLLLAYPVVKAIHELGHGFAAKRWGGEVHEIGIMLLVFMPVPYVDASAASAFQDKYKRALVGAAGILVELFLAALAMILWVNAEPGLVRAFAFSVMLIGGVSTLLFNGNPLLRFDGYYVLCDLIEVPNLGTRANGYLGWLAQRRLLGMREAEQPPVSRGEPVWLVGYAVAAYIYRVFIALAIALFVAGKAFFVGVLIALWALGMQFVWPLLRGLSFVLTSPRLDRRRARAVLATAFGIAGLAAFLALVPLPSWTRAEGVVWLPEQARVRAAADGLVVRLLAEPGTRVAAGDPLIETEDPYLEQQVRLLGARRRELDARLTQAQLEDRAQAQVVREEIRAVEADLARARERLDALTIRAETAGRFVVPNEQDLPGRFVHRGATLGYVSDPAAASVRAVVDQDSIGLVRERTLGVALRAADWDAGSVPSRILRQVPAATSRLPSPALGSAGGGPIPLDPRDSEGLTALREVFVLDLELPSAVAGDYAGRRVLVRFDHGAEPLAVQWYRSIRQVFLSRLGV